MNKVISYTLNDDGTIPDFIIDGGYFPRVNNNASPQDITIIGIATNQSPGNHMDQESLTLYLEEFLSGTTDIDGNEIIPSDLAQSWWDNHIEIINGQ